jgi:hypothetical protein
MAKIGRNGPCRCGSGKKSKKCCGRLASAGPSHTDLRKLVEGHQASERIRQNQQGFGRPIIAPVMNGHQLVAVKDKLYWSTKWKTFPDFLAHYIRDVLGGPWGNAEIAKPLEERHPVMQWYDALCHYQLATIKVPGQVSTAPVTGVVGCYLGLAYSLYLLAHNVELQDRLVKRLKDPRNFQGAYYELIVANILIRAGFELVLEDEADGASRHCEFAAISKHSGKKYWVEAKMRAMNGFLGYSGIDGKRAANPISRLIPHLNDALGKPAANERLIFIDLNAEPDVPTSSKPIWADQASRRLEEYERNELRLGLHAYVFVTNMAYHRALDRMPVASALPFGLGIHDFNRTGVMQLSEAYRRKRKHSDAYRIADTFSTYLNFPVTFDGSMPSEAFGQTSNRIKIGETYGFPGTDGEAVVGTVTTAAVEESRSMAVFGVSTTDGRAMLFQYSLSEAELADYRSNRDAYFGRIQRVSRTITDPFEFFEWGGTARFRRQTTLSWTYREHRSRDLI